MAQTTAAQRGTEQASDKNAIRPFHVNVPEAETYGIAQAHQRDKVA
jgi:hypothetical protein